MVCCGRRRCATCSGTFGKARFFTYCTVASFPNTTSSRSITTDNCTLTHHHRLLLSPPFHSSTSSNLSSLASAWRSSHLHHQCSPPLLLFTSTSHCSPTKAPLRNRNRNHSPESTSTPTTPSCKRSSPRSDSAMPSSTTWRHAGNPATLRISTPPRPSSHEIEPLSPTTTPTPSPAPFLGLSLPDPPPISTQENGHSLRGLGLSDVGISDSAVTIAQPEHLFLDQDGAAHVRVRECLPDSAASQSPTASEAVFSSSRNHQIIRGKGHTRSGSTIADLANAAIATSPAPATASPYSRWKEASHPISRPSTSYTYGYPYQDSTDGPPAKRIKSERLAPQEWVSNTERPRTSGHEDPTSMKDALLLLGLRNETNFKNSTPRRASTSTYSSSRPPALSPQTQTWDVQNHLPPQGLSGCGNVSLEILDGGVEGPEENETSPAQSEVNKVQIHRPSVVNGEPSKRKHSRASESISKGSHSSRRKVAAFDSISPPTKRLKLEHEDPDDDVRCAACQRIEPDRVDDEKRTLWIQCGPCKRWYHAQCAGYSTKADAEAVNAYVCMNCEPVHGKTTYVRKSSRARPNIDYDALNQGLVKSSVETATHHYIQPFKEGKFALLPDDFARVRPELLTVDFMQNSNGMKRPFVVPGAWNPRFGVQAPFAGTNPKQQTETDEAAPREAFDAYGHVVKDHTPGPAEMSTEQVVDCGQDLLDMVIPRNLTVRRVAELYGLDELVPVIDVKTQETKGQFTLQQWADYYEQPGDKPIRNVISLEVSQSPLGKLIRRPRVVRDLDLEDHVWDTDIEARTKKRPVQFYCLMSVADSYTDFHIDFGGSSVYYHILKGTKTFFFIPPEDKYLKKYENWCNSDTQNETWLGKECENNCIRVDLHEGDTAFIPAGWIHSVWTPEDSLVIGGNFLTRIDYEMQLKVANIEKVTKVAAKFRYPYFQKVMWYSLIKYLEEDPVPEELLEEFREDPDYVYLRANPTWHEVQDLENVAEPGSPEYHARFYPKSEASGWPALRDYLYRTARIDAGLPVSDITKKQVDSVKASIPKGHGSPLSMIKVFAIWCAWKFGNVPAPDWVHSDAALEGDKADKMKKPETFRLPGERSSSRRAAQAQSQARNSPAVESPVTTPKQPLRSASKGSGLRVACDPCRKRRIKCRHKAGSDMMTRAAPEIRPRSFSNTDVSQAEPPQTNGASSDPTSSPEMRYAEALDSGGDIGPLSLPPAEPGSSSSKKSRSKACEECRKSKVCEGPLTGTDDIIA